MCKADSGNDPLAELILFDNFTKSRSVTNMYLELLKERNLPPLQSREDMLKVLQEEEYGFLPPAPEDLTWEIKKNVVPRFCGNKATYDRVTLRYTLCGKTGEFPVSCVIPNKPGKHPFFVMPNFRADVPDRFMPTEELVDNGFAVLSFYYQDVTKDDADWTDGLAGILYPDGVRHNPTDPGKIAMWVWAMHRVMDYAQTLEQLDLNNAVACGHSRLGKTALLAAATDTRFTHAHSNDSGCGGAAITREKVGETVAEICKRFPYWFCENYQKYIDRESEMPFDQHFLIASIAPRYVSVNSAIEDTWADPLSEMLSCIAASEAFEGYQMDGFVYDERAFAPEITFGQGSIGYYLRPGTHYFSREDWHALFAFIRNHFNRN